jgi:hypothetical protein
MEFLRVSSFWELMMKPVLSVRYISHLCMLTKIQNPSVSRIHYMQVAFCVLLGFWSFGSDLGPLSFFLLPPLLGAIVGLMEFLRVSWFWELMMKPLSWVRYTRPLVHAGQNSKS